MASDGSANWVIGCIKDYTDMHIALALSGAMKCP
jgi:hypothetical protein